MGLGLLAGDLYGVFRHNPFNANQPQRYTSGKGSTWPETNSQTSSVLRMSAGRNCHLGWGSDIHNVDRL